MKRTLVLSIAIAFCSVLLQAKTPPKPADFSGNWILDTSQTKNVPDGLDSYTMKVIEDQQQVKVDTVLQGDLQPRADSGQYPGGGGQYPNGSGYPGRSRGGMGGGMGGIGFPGGMGGGMGRGGMGGPMGGGMPGGRRGGMGGPSQSQRNERMALSLYPKSAVYKLDGTASSAELGKPEQTDATATAAWAKGGKTLKLKLVAQGDSDQKGSQTQLTDQWKMDGQYLKVDRSIHSPSGSGTVHLVFRKQTADDSAAAGSASQTQ